MNQNTFFRLFPFAFTTDRTLKILSVGPSLKKLRPDIQIGTEMTSVFDIERPKIQNTANEFIKIHNEMIVLKDNLHKAKFMGQVISENDQVLVVVSLMVTDGEELRNLKLDFSDFPIQDQIFDFLMLTQAQRQMIQKSENLNRQLLEANKIAVQASLMKSQFLANMSHELRTPMNGVLGMANLMLETELTEEQREYIDCINTSGEGMLALINDILDLSKIEAGHVKLDFEEFELGKCLADVLQTVYPLASKKDISLSVFSDPEAPSIITSDRQRLRQVILNLLSNSIKFTEKGSVQLRVENLKDDLIFRVIDTGIGMSSETLNKLFRPFEQGDSSMSKKYGGTGLGLSISRMLVQAMGGDIEAQSEVGKGSEFRFTIKKNKLLESQSSKAA